MSSQRNRVTENWLPVKNITDGMIILNNNDKVSGVKIIPRNIFILSEEEQNMVISNLKQVYNQIDYEFWLVVADRPVDISVYMSRLQVMYNQTTSVAIRKLIMEDIQKANGFINNSVIKPMEASKIQEEFALKNNKAPEMYTFFIVDNYYVFTSYFLPKIPNASIKGIWVDATTGKAKYVLEDIRIRAYKPYTEKENAYPF